MADGLGNIYTPSKAEWNAVVQSYNNLGGAQALGMDLNTWARSQGIGSVDKGFMGNAMDWMGSDAAKNVLGVGGLALSGFGAYNAYNAGKQAKKQWEAENARANEIMAMNREKYNTYKADKARLNAGYSGLAASGV